MIDSILGYVAILQVLLSFGSFYFFIQISTLRLTSKRPWFMFAFAFLLATYRRIYTYSTIGVGLQGKIFSLDFLVKIVIPFVTSVIIFVALFEIYGNFKKNYKQLTDKKYEEVLHDKID